MNKFASTSSRRKVAQLHSTWSVKRTNREITWPQVKREARDRDKLSGLEWARRSKRKQEVSYYPDTTTVGAGSNFSVHTSWVHLYGVCTNGPGVQVEARQHVASVATFISSKDNATIEETFKVPHEADWTPFQTQYFSENLVVPGIERGTSGSVVRNSDH
jgi:hypothetical protein